MFKDKSLQYLNKGKENQLEKDLYYGRNAEHMNSDEFEYKTRDIDWVATGIIPNSIDLISDLIGINKVKVEFEDDKQTEYFQELLNKEGYSVLEKAVIDRKVYGDAYIQIAVEDNLYTAQEDYSVRFYNIDPEIVHADYNKYLPQRGAQKYTVVHYEKKDEVLYALLIHFAPSSITLEAVKDPGKETEEFVDPLEYFEEFFSTDLQYVKRGLSYTLDLSLNYSALTHFHGIREYGEFYTHSDISTPIISKIQLIDRMYNLADIANTTNARPKLKLSTATANLLRDAIQEVNDSDTGAESVSDIPLSFADKVNTSKRGVSYEFSQIAQKMNDKLVFFEDDGRGETAYITNPFELKDLYELIDRATKDVYNDLHISEVLYSQDISTGQLSGVALKRLMSRTIEHIETIRNQFTPKIKQLAITALQMAKNSNIPDASYSDDIQIKSVTFPEITYETIQEVIEKYNSAIKLKPSEELKDKAVSQILDLDIKTVENMKTSPSLKETLSLSLNGPRDTNPPENQSENT